MKRAIIYGSASKLDFCVEKFRAERIKEFANTERWARKDFIDLVQFDIELED